MPRTRPGSARATSCASRPACPALRPRVDRRDLAARRWVSAVGGQAVEARVSLGKDALAFGTGRAPTTTRASPGSCSAGRVPAREGYPVFLGDERCSGRGPQRVRLHRRSAVSNVPRRSTCARMLPLPPLELKLGVEIRGAQAPRRRSRRFPVLQTAAVRGDDGAARWIASTAKNTNGSSSTATLRRSGLPRYAQHSLGDIVYVELPRIGAQIEQFGSAGVVESVKAVSDLFTPIGGEVVEVNSALEEDPALVNREPFARRLAIQITRRRRRRAPEPALARRLRLARRRRLKARPPRRPRRRAPYSGRSSR